MRFESNRLVSGIDRIGAIPATDFSTARSFLKQFQRPEWIYHHPISNDQLDFAGITDAVKGAGFNHGVFLYLLFQTPGVWHEQCLESARRD
jgi:hypothetical protein